MCGKRQTMDKLSLFRKAELGTVLRRYHSELLDCLLELGHSPHIYPFSQLLEDYQVYILQLPDVGQPSTPSHSCWRTIRYIPQLPAVGQPSTPSHSC